MEQNINAMKLVLESIDNIFNYIDFVDLIGFFLMFLGMFLIGKWVFNSRKYSENIGYMILTLWINAIPVYAGAIILGLKYGFK